jgi:hypothetical protein
VEFDFFRRAHTNKIIGARFFYYGLSRIQDSRVWGFSLLRVFSSSSFLFCSSLMRGTLVSSGEMPENKYIVKVMPNITFLFCLIIQ